MTKTFWGNSSQEAGKAACAQGNKMGPSALTYILMAELEWIRPEIY